MCVERVLAGLGYQFAGPDMFFGVDSVNSLKAYQRTQRLLANGILGAATGRSLRVWPGSNPLPAAAAAPGAAIDGTPLPIGGCTVSGAVRLNTRGPDAICAERVLAGLGYQFPGPDDLFGIDSVNSVKAFQRGKRVRADGVIGAATGRLLGIWPGSPPASAAPAAEPAAAPAAAPEPEPAVAGASGLPANSGSGRRVVYSRAQQRIWAVEADGTVVKTHRVSGRTREPYAGTYHVYSRSMYTYSTANPAIKWRYMVRFAYGPGGGRIGFHEIPTKNGAPLQSSAQLGQALSGGCVRQSTADAIWMWNWAGIGTKVVVL